MIGKTLSHYEILEQLGEGGMGAVYLARDTRLLRQVAIKVVLSEKTSPTQKQRFIQEARAASALNHPGIVSIYDFGHEDNFDYIVMEYVPGESLADRIARGRLPWLEAHRYALQMAQAMAKAHSAGIIHRDLKPHNVMIAEDAQIKILDFGIAKLSAKADFALDAQTVSHSLTGEGRVVGTLAYMSPEQAIGDAVDERSDIFSLGVVFYQMLAGVRPFEGNSDASLLHQLHFDTPISVNDIRDDLPPGIDRVLETALAKNPKDRYQGMAQLAGELSGLALGSSLAHEVPTVSARPVNPAEVLTGPSTGEQLVPTPTSRVLTGPVGTGGRRWRWLAIPIALIIAGVAGVMVINRSEIGLAEDPTGSTHLVVLAPENISGEPSLQSFCTGLSESITHGLTQMKEFEDRLKIVPAAEVRQAGIRSARHAREEFGVDLVITGSVQRTEKNLRLNLGMIDSRTERQLTAVTEIISAKERPFAERRVLMKVVGLLRQRFGEPEPASPVDSKGQESAFHFYRQGMALLSEHLKRLDKKENIDQAIESFQRALGVDANFASAHAGLSRAYWRKFNANKDPMWIEKAIQTARRAVELDEHLALARVSLGLALLMNRQHDEAERELNQALSLDPFSADANRGLGQVFQARGDRQKAEQYLINALNLRPSDAELLDILGVMYLQTGQYDKAEQRLLQSLKIAPENAKGYNNLAGVYYMQGQLSKAATQMQRALEIAPSAMVYSNLGMIYYSQGRYIDAVAAHQKAVALPGGAHEHSMWGNLAMAYRFTPGNSNRAEEAIQTAINLSSEKMAQDPQSPTLRSFVAFYLALQGEHSKALRHIGDIAPEKVVAPDIHYRFTVVYELAGKRKSALMWLDRAIAAGYPIDDFRREPLFVKLREDPRFHTLIAKARLNQSK